MFGFLSRGDLEVVPEKLQYSAGDTIKGKVTLKLKKPTQASKLSIVLAAFRRQFHYDPQTRGQREVTVPVFNFSLPLAGAQEYSEGEYPFEIKIPPDAGVQSGYNPNSETFGGKIMEVATVLGAVTSGMGGPAEWCLEAHLDIPGAIDMRKTIQINVA